MSDIIFKRNTTRLGQTVFNDCKDNQLKKREDKRTKMRQQKKAY